MANYLTTDTELTSVANAIRTKGGTSASLSYPSGFVSAIENIPTGGSSVDEDADVLFIDYDGTPVASKTKTEINAMTSDSDLPANPTHTGLTAQGWNWTVAQLKAQLTAMPDQQVIVGQMYVTTSGATEIDVEMQEGRLSPCLIFATNGTVTIDWGDNTTPDTISGSSLSSRKTPSHTYNSAGNYTIKMQVSNGKFKFYTTSSYLMFSKADSNDSYENTGYASCVKSIRFGTGILEICNSNCYNCLSLETVTIPKTITSIGGYSFSQCYQLKSVTIPDAITQIGMYTFSKCNSLMRVSIPSSVTSIYSDAFEECNSLERVTIGKDVLDTSGYAFNKCYKLKELHIPINANATEIKNYMCNECRTIENVTMKNNITTISADAFSKCHNLKNLQISENLTAIGTEAFLQCFKLTKFTIPDGVTSIGNSAFSYCSGMKEYHIRPTTPPTLGTNVFNKIAVDCIIYVPYSADHSVLNAYKTATNWSTYASYIQEEPQ